MTAVSFAAFGVVAAPLPEASTSGGLAFFGLLVAMVGSAILAVALRRADVAPRAVAGLLAAPVVLVASFVVGQPITDALGLGFDAVWVLFLLTFCAGWIALGDVLRYSPEETVSETVAPVV